MGCGGRAIELASDEPAVGTRDNLVREEGILKGPYICINAPPSGWSLEPEQTKDCGAGEKHGLVQPMAFLAATYLLTRIG